MDLLNVEVFNFAIFFVNFVGITDSTFKRSMLRFKFQITTLPSSIRYDAFCVSRGFKK